MVMQAVLPTNPFGSAQALANSSYGAFRDGKLVRPLGGTPTGIEEFVHDSFRALVLNPKFSCVAAKSAINLGNYRIGNYAELGAQPSMEGLAHDLYAFVQEQPSFEGFSTFVATFNAPATGDELAFERRLWAALQRLHLIDRAHHGWDPSVSSDPESKDFSFSFAGAHSSSSVSTPGARASRVGLRSRRSSSTRTRSSRSCVRPANSSESRT